MKKLFSKALSLVLTLALLATVFTCIGVTASAASGIIKTPENAAKEVYFFDFNNAQAYQGEYIARIVADEEAGIDCTGAIISVSFDYYFKSNLYATRSNEIFIRNWEVSQDTRDANFVDDSTGKDYLYDGMGTFTVEEYESPKANFTLGASPQGFNGSNAKLYIWNLQVRLNGELVDTNPIDDGTNRASTVDVSVVSYQDMLNAQRAWKITGSELTTGSFASFTNINTSAGKTVKVSFEYYYDTSTDLGLHISNVGAGGQLSRTETKIDDVVVSSTKIVPGVHKFTSTYDVTGSVVALQFEVSSGVTFTGDLRVWNMVVEINGAKQAPQYFENGYGFDSRVTQKGVTLESATYGEIMGTRKAFCLDYTKFEAANNNNGHYLCYINDFVNSPEITISFNYMAIGSPRTKAVNVHDGNNRAYTATGGDTVGDYWLLTDGEEHYYEYVGSALNQTLALNLRLEDNSGSSNLKIYVWDLVVRRNTNYRNEQNSETNTTCIKRHVLTGSRPMTTVTYADVKNATPVMALDFAGTESEVVEGEVNSAKYQLSGNPQGGDESDISISFEYYLADAADDEISVVNVAGGNMADDKTGTSYLQPGRHTFTINRKFSTFSASGYNVLVAVGLAKAGIESNAKLYIWNLNCTRTFEDGTVSSFGGYEKGIFGESQYIGPEASMVTYADVDNKTDANNDGTTNVLDLIRAKRVALNSYLVYDKENLDYIALDSTALVKIKLAVLAK